MFVCTYVWTMHTHTHTHTHTYTHTYTHTHTCMHTYNDSCINTYNQTCVGEGTSKVIKVVFTILEALRIINSVVWFQLLWYFPHISVYTHKFIYARTFYTLSLFYTPRGQTLCKHTLKLTWTSEEQYIWTKKYKSHQSLPISDSSGGGRPKVHVRVLRLSPLRSCM